MVGTKRGQMSQGSGIVDVGELVGPGLRGVIPSELMRSRRRIGASVSHPREWSDLLLAIRIAGSQNEDEAVFDVSESL